MTALRIAGTVLMWTALITVMIIAVPICAALWLVFGEKP
jgi:hypothetical protein